MPDLGQDSGTGFPAAFELFQLEGDERKAGIALNVEARRPAIGDQEAFWIENLFSIGPANHRSLWNNATPIWSSGTIISMQSFNIGPVAYICLFLSTGAAWQVQLSNGATTLIGGANAFFPSGTPHFPHIAQLAASGIVIVSDGYADGYWAWDGSLHGPGTPSPAWLNGGTPTTMPTGVNGTDVEIFLSRVWIVSGTNILTSAATNGATFSAPGLTKPNSDSSLRVQYVAIMALNGYLYVFGDSSCAYITNVQTSGGNTTYQYTVIDAQIGTPWRDSLVPFGRALLFANANGIYALYGSSANKISDELNNIWNQQAADFVTVIPSSAVCTIYGIKTFVICVRTTDLSTNTQRNILCYFDGKKWGIASQTTEPLLITPQETNSVLSAWGTDGANLFQMFATPSASLQKKVVSKLWGGRTSFVMWKQALRFYLQYQQIAAQPIVFEAQLDTEQGSNPISITTTTAINWVNNSGNPIQWQNNSLQPIQWQTQEQIAYADANGTGRNMGFTLTSFSADFVLERAALGYKNLTALY